MNYPLQSIFENHLFQQQLAAQTVLSYRHDLINFFRFLASNGRQPTELKAITESDLRAYFLELKKAADITAATYNKVLSHLNQYFIFLFQAKQISTLPTLGLKSTPVTSNQPNQLFWSDQLAELLANPQISFYGRLTLLLTAHFFQSTEFLEADFYQIWQFEALNNFERQFMQQFKAFHQPLAKNQICEDLFLKRKTDHHAPRLTLPALHKYLKKDQNWLPFPFSPKNLRRDAILSFLIRHRNLTSLTCCRKLHLDLKSLNYYRLLSYQPHETTSS
ncbi:site-specific integrase [Liquorilactobacillus sicerae]|uniref:site-specific integrase n=1 Tax=Liquorilactobacillus sicerae TaxID=1416943 RepID=UPI002480FA1F|nr:site-specific integrase [Liquorilactobacillus sicerae]